VNVFILLAAALLSVALAFVAVPLMRDRSRFGQATVGLVALVLVLGVVALYGKVGNREWTEPQKAALDAPHSIDEMVGRLEARLNKNPGDVDGWLMLGRSYFVQNNFPKAASAFEHAYDASKGQNVEAIVSYAEALTVTNQSALSGKAGELFETALTMDGNNQKALWYGGMAQAAKGNYSVAHDRWMTLIRQDLPAEIKPVLADRIRELDQAMGHKADPELDRLSPPGAAKNAAAAASGGGESPAAPAATAGGMTVHVHIEVAPSMKGKIPAGAPLFVLARDPTQPGPPFAAKRLASAALPLDIDLSEQDAMMPGRTLKDAHQLVIVARYSASGQPQQASGDVYGQATLGAGAKSVRLSIDQQVP
jgi:cytochrome c-type biogenesis protein CcmH